MADQVDQPKARVLPFYRCGYCKDIGYYLDPDVTILVVYRCRCASGNKCPNYNYNPNDY